MMMHSTGNMDNRSIAEEVYELSNTQQNRQSLESSLALYMAVSLMAIIVIVGGIGNVMVILAVRTTKKLQTVSNAFVVNLSVCDLVFVMVILPFNMYTYLIDGWNLPLFLCKLIGFLGYTLTGTTIITITMIAWNRYKLVVDPQNYQRIFSRRHLTIMLTLAWLMPMLCLVPAVFEVWGRFGYVTMMVTCNLLLDHDSQSFKLFLLIIRAVIPCFLILFYYISIYRTTKASHRRVRSKSLLTPTLSRMDQMIQRKEMHLTKMMGTIFIIFALSYFPCTISSIVDWNTVLSKRYHMFCLITVYVGSAVNPLIYGLMNSQFRRAYYSILICQCCISGPDDMLIPSYSPTPCAKKHTQGKQQKCSKLNQITEKLPTDLSPIPAVSSNNLPYSHASTESNDHKYSLSGTSRETKIHVSNLSIDSEDPTPPSSQDTEMHLDRNLHRSDTEKTCVGDCDFEECTCHDPFII